MSTREKQHARRAFARRVRTILPRLCFEFATLERRQLLCGSHEEILAGSPTHEETAPVQMGPEVTASAAPESQAFLASTDTNPAGLPLLSSNPAAKAKLFLDFDGSTINNAVPYDNDNVPGTFSSGEAANIVEVWQRTAEKYAPFDLDVTTVDPGDRKAREVGVVTISRSTSTGGYAYVDVFKNGTLYGVTNASPFASNEIVAEVTMHEAGHLLGLWHQSLYDAAGNKLQEYYVGDALRAPIMGSLYSAQRALWWNGPSSLGSTINQNDLAILAGKENAFGYRADDHGDTFNLADGLTLEGSTNLSATGLIETTADADVFGFFAGEGDIDLAVDVFDLGPSLDASLELWRSTDGEPYELVAASASSDLSESLSFHADDSAFYRVIVASAGEYGDIGQYTLSGTAPVIPSNIATPSLVSATVVSASRIDVRWLDNATNETGYRVERTSNGGSTWTPVATLAADTSGFSDTTTAAAQTYHYRVFATGSPGWSDPSDLARASTRNGPANARSTSVGFTKVTLAWDADPSAVGYVIEKSTDGGANWSHVAVASGNATTFQVTGLAVDTDYQFRVRSKNGDYSLAGNTVAVHTSFLAVPGTPNPVTATTYSAYAIDLSWPDVAGEESYRVERSTDGSTWTLAGTVAANATSFRDYNWTPDTLFSYRVAGINEAGQSPWSDVVSARTDILTAPAAPTNLHILEYYGTSFVLHWDDNSDTESDFVVERLDAGSGNWVNVGSVGEENYPYFWTGYLAANTAFTYRVKAVNAAGESAASNEVAFTTPPPMPENFRVTSAPSPDEIHLAWDDVAGEVAYRLEREFQDSDEWSVIATLDANATGFIDSGLIANEWYNYRLVATNGERDSEPAFMTFTAPPGAPQAPATLTAVPSNSQRAINLSWTNVDFETGYKVERSPDGLSGWSQIATTGSNINAYTDLGRTPGTTYHYRVRATNIAGDSNYSPVASATAMQPTAPAAPSNLVHVESTEEEITFEWQDNSDNEAEFVIEGLLWDPWDHYWYFGEIDRVPAGETSYTAGGFYAGSTTSFRVRAVNDGGVSASSNQLDTQTLPSAPGLSATAPSSNLVNLTWNAGPGATDGYRIQRSLSATSGWSTIATVAAGVLNYADNTVSANVRYYYRVLSLSPVGDSGPSNVVNVLTPNQNVPAVPTGVAATATSTSQINVTWSDVATETSYTVQRSTDNVTFANFATVGANVTTFADNGLSAGSRYYYKVVASNAAGSSQPSSTATAITYTAAPTNLVATPSTTTATRVDLAWSNVTGNSGYRIERSTDGGANWGSAGQTGANVTTFTDNVATPGTAHLYRVKAFNSAGDSAPSNTSSALTIPAAPGGLATSVASSSQVNLTWSDITGETSFVIERSDNAGSTWTQAGTTAANVTSFSDTALSAATTYLYRVRAANATGSGVNSSTAGATTRTLAPTGLAASAASDSQINLTWSDVAGETGYLVERSLNGSTGWAQVGSVAANTTTFSSTGLLANTTYFYRVIATNAGGPSLPSNTASATTPLAVPAGPSALVLTVLSKTSIRLNWADNATNETGFRIERSLNGTTGWTQVGTVGANVMTFTNTGLTRNTRYYYRVVAYNSAGNSPYSNVATAVTLK